MVLLGHLLGQHEELRLNPELSSEHASLLHGLLEDVVQIVEVGIIPGERHAHVQGRLDDALRLGQVLVGRRELPVFEIPSVGRVTEELQEQTAVLGGVDDGLDLDIGSLLEVELDAVADDGDLGVLLRNLDARKSVQAIGEGVVPRVVLLAAGIDGVDLGPDHGGADAMHAERVVRQLGHDLLEVFGARNCQMLGVELLVSTGVDSSGGTDLRIVGQQEAALARVEHLV